MFRVFWNSCTRNFGPFFWNCSEKSGASEISIILKNPWQKYGNAVQNLGFQQKQTPRKTFPVFWNRENKGRSEWRHFVKIAGLLSRSYTFQKNHFVHFSGDVSKKTTILKIVGTSLKDVLVEFLLSNSSSPIIICNPTENWFQHMFPTSFSENFQIFWESVCDGAFFK